MAQLSEPQSPAFIVVVTGRGLQATALAVLLSAPIAVVAAHRDPDCVVIVGADEPRVRAVVATHPRALVLAVSPSASAAAMLAAGAAACVTDADPRLIAARLRALWRRFSSGQPQQREDAAPLVSWTAGHAREPQP